MSDWKKYNPAYPPCGVSKETHEIQFRANVGFNWGELPNPLPKSHYAYYGQYRYRPIKKSRYPDITKKGYMVFGLMLGAWLSMWFTLIVIKMNFYPELVISFVILALVPSLSMYYISIHGREE